MSTHQPAETNPTQDSRSFSFGPLPQHFQSNQEAHSKIIVNMTGSNGNGNGAQVGTLRVKQGLAQMLKGGVIVSCLFRFLHGDGCLAEGSVVTVDGQFSYSILCSKVMFALTRICEL